MKPPVDTCQLVPEPEAFAESREPELPVQKIVIEGGRTLEGEVEVAGAKNAVLPIIAAFLLAPGKSTLTRVPNLRDVHTMSDLARALGASVSLEDDRLIVDATRLTSAVAPYKLVSRMRASFYVLGPLLARLGEARVSLPGGCAWGPRPVNLHIDGLRALGAEIDVDHGYVVARAKKLVGAPFHFDIASVGATAHVMMAAVLAEGVTELTNAACEPEISALAECLSAMGARVEGAGTPTVRIEGTKELAAVSFENIPDRIEAGTYLIAGAMAGGRVVVSHACPAHLTALIAKLRQMGVRVDVTEDAILVEGCGRPEPADVTTQTYPGFPTDLQAQLMAYLALADGTSRINETIYSDRFTHVPELRRLGADITVTGGEAMITGVPHLSGAYVKSTDLRASATLILAGLVAEGETHVTHVHHLDRGYEALEQKLSALGAAIRREEHVNGEE